VAQTWGVPPSQRSKTLPFGGSGEFPVLSPLYRVDDTKEQIDAILEQHDAGNFMQSAGLVDQMMTNDRLRGLAGTRADGLLACPVKVTPARERRVDRKLSELIGGNGQDVQGCWRDICSAHAMRQLLEWGWFLGVAVAEQTYDTETGVPRLSPWHPSQLRWDATYERFVLNSKKGAIYLPRPDLGEVSREWFLWCPFGVKYGWRRAYVRSLGEKYLSGQWNDRDWDRHNEKHGLAIVEAKVPSGASGPDKERYLEGLENLGSEGLVFSPQGKAGDASFGIQLHEATARTWETFKERKSSLYTDFAILLFGQDLPTESKGGGGLGNGTAKSADAVRGDKKAEDAEIGPALRAQVFKPWVEYAYGDPDLTPFFEFETKPEDDKKAKGDAHLVTAQAIKAYQDAGVEVNGDEMAEGAGAPLLSPEEAAAKQAERDQRAAASADAMAAAAGGAGAASGDGQGEADDRKDKVDDAEGAGDEGQKSAALRIQPPGVAKRYDFQGLPIAVENLAGSTRIWQSEDGKSIGSTRMLYDYGFIEGVTSGDGEELDCYVGDDSEATDVHIVHQLLAPDYKRHDEDKTMLGFSDAGAAKAAYLAHRNDGERAFGGMSTIPLDRFRAKLKRRAPESTGKIRASVTALKTPRVTAGKGKVARYIDQLDAKAAAAGAKSMRPFLEAILASIDEVIAEGGTYDDVKARAAARLKVSDGAALAQIAKHSRIMGYLGGRAAILNLV